MEIKEVIEDLGRSFEAFKETNEQRIAAIEAGKSTAELDAKLEKINAAVSAADAQKAAIEKSLNERIDDLEAKANRQGLGGDAARPEVAEHRKAYINWARTGDGESALKALERKAVSVGTATEGGNAVPELIDRMVVDTLVDISPMRSICSVVRIGTSDYKVNVNSRGTASGWVGESTARTDTATPTLNQVTVPMGEVYAHAPATQQSLDDIFFDVEAWLADNIATEFAQEEGAAFITGNGTNRPKGFLDETTAATADGSRTFGEIEHVATGVAGDFAATNKGDILFEVSHKLKAGHRAGAVWLMNKALLSEIRQFKGSDNNYLWQPNLAGGQPSTLLGYPVVEAEDMPAKAADSLSIAFGNFQRGYRIADRVGMRTLRDPYSDKPNVIFYATKRVGGKLIDDEAIKVVKFAV